MGWKGQTHSVIKSRTPGWATHKLENYIAEVLPQECSEPHIGLFSPGVLHQQDEPPEHLAFKACRALILGVPKDWGK